MKKAQIGTTQALLISTVIIVILLTVFFFFIRTLSIGKAISSVEGSSMQQQIIYSLKAYLNTPIEVDGTIITMSDLIRISSFSSDMKYTELARTETNKIFNRIYSKWALSSTSGFSAGSGVVAAQKSIISADIPDMKGGKITVYLGLS